ncbi:alanine--tRNA ligase, cytoplasmic-like [Neocloeon triangulifer]|uniref:alanine--tRNA ligase, cytoplasmic-like n=1 Tax=Neocloeon triangulifer TaxID=2078957 RepID=UPI00286F3B52|nr:alanine--tRNA ligase, cytoplasmic-like [Neocloeon triangulifer]
MYRVPKVNRLFRRSFSTPAGTNQQLVGTNTASDIRKTFIEYFVNEHGHKFVKSSSVMPPGDDPTLLFVNAGMNQFKSVLLGKAEPVTPRAVNSQKCIRVGGKHNDLEAVGKDSTHHTFFEMLGNWSFSDYFKEDACKMAWNLMTGPYGLDRDKLVVTYFGGHTKSNLKADQDCAEVWRSMGLLPRQIIPLGMDDNFWEMGLVGPCGPCTEIYYVKDGKLMELWNLVFVEYERKTDGELLLLPKKHVDTGMGLERLTRVLQGVDSNYDTDLFKPLIKIVEKVSNKEKYSGVYNDEAILDTAYRILADHSRAISIALADGMYPNKNHRLRKIIVKCFSLSETVFNKQGIEILPLLVEGVTEILGESYPELQTNLGRSQELIRQEFERYKELKSQAKSEWGKVLEEYPSLQSLPDDHPGLARAVNKVKDCKEINGKLAFYLYSKFGLDEVLIQSLAECLDIPVDLEGLHKLRNADKIKTIASSDNLEKILADEHVPPTGDQSKYYWEYRNGHYIFSEQMDCKILALLQHHTLLQQVKAGERCTVIVDHTHFYHKSGGQISDSGILSTTSGTGEVVDVQRHGKYVAHTVNVTEGTLSTGEIGKLKLNTANRLGCMQNHSATHLLNAALRKLLPSVHQRASLVTPNFLNFDFSTQVVTKGGDPPTLNDEQIQFLEDFVNEQIKAALPVARSTVSLTDLPQGTVKTPGEKYPETVTVVTIGKDVSIEPCWGTHCNNTADLLHFCIISETSDKTGALSLRALTGHKAQAAVQEGRQAEQEVSDLQLAVQGSYNGSKISESVKVLMNKLKENDVPLLVKKRLINSLSEIDKKVSGDRKAICKELVEKHVKECLAKSKSPYIVSLLSSKHYEPLSLRLANTMCLPDKASLFIAKDGDGFLRGRCVVPVDLVSASFDAQSWMSPVLKILGAEGGAPLKKDGKSHFLMNPKKLTDDFDSALLDKALKEAENYARASLLLSALQREQ